MKSTSKRRLLKARKRRRKIAEPWPVTVESQKVEIEHVELEIEYRQSGADDDENGSQ